jgi:hypothetical protein
MPPGWRIVPNGTERGFVHVSCCAARAFPRTNDAPALARPRGDTTLGCIRHTKGPSMFSEDDDTLGAARLDDLQQRRITGFDYDNVSMAFDGNAPEKTLMVMISPNDTLVGTWTRKGGLLHAHFPWQTTLYGTRSVDDAYRHTVEMVRQFRRRRAGASAN